MPKRGAQFPYEYSYDGSDNLRHKVTAHHKGEEVGYLIWGKDSYGVISGLHVNPEHRDKGVATGMYLHAKSLGVKGPEHSEERTQDGNGWAHAMVKRFGGHLPRWGFLEDGEEDI
jgi:hypothetical protein